MRADLTTAMKSRDRATVSVLRSALAAIDNAEAVAVDQSAPTTSLSEHVAGVAGPSEVARRELTDADIATILTREITERETAATDYVNVGQAAVAQELRAEADLLRRYRAATN